MDETFRQWAGRRASAVVSSLWAWGVLVLVFVVFLMARACSASGVSLKQLRADPILKRPPNATRLFTSERQTQGSPIGTLPGWAEVAWATDMTPDELSIYYANRYTSYRESFEAVNRSGLPERVKRDPLRIMRFEGCSPRSSEKRFVCPRPVTVTVGPIGNLGTQTRLGPYKDVQAAPTWAQSFAIARIDDLEGAPPR